MNEQSIDRMKLIVGLGNPGARYARTRHNLGWRVVESLAKRWTAAGPKSAFRGRVWDARPSRGGQVRRVLLFQPETFMNFSGQAVRELAGFHRLERADVLVAMDDLALPVGRLRVRADGSAGGHKGLADVIVQLGGDDVARLRIGIGAAPFGMDAADYVLQAFGPDEVKTVEQAVESAAEAAEEWVFGGLESVMRRYNPKTEKPQQAAPGKKGAENGKTGHGISTDL